jgi:Xaa-Pro aminopeptidase
MSNISLEKVRQAITLMQGGDIDVWLTFARETMQTPDPALDLIFPHNLTWDSAFLVSRSGRSLAIIGRYDADNVRKEGAYDDVRTYDQGISQALREAVAELAPKRIGLNYSLSDTGCDGLSHGNFLRLQQMLGDLAELASADELVRRLRESKSASELARIRETTRMQQAVYAEMFKLPLRGMNELDIQNRAHEIIARHGLEIDGDPAANPIVNAGPESSIGHGLPSAALTLQPGMVLHFDMWLRHNGYCADLQRCAYVLRPGEIKAPDLVQRAWDSCWLALEAGKAALKPGVAAWEVDNVAREALVECGYDEYLHAFGHHIGRATHDGGSVLGPRWERYGDRPFKQIDVGSVFTLELGVILEGHGYIGIEEMVVVTETGNEFISTPQRELRLI